VAAGTTTVFFLITASVTMHFAPSALPVVDFVTGKIRFATLTF